MYLESIVIPFLEEHRFKFEKVGDGVVVPVRVRERVEIYIKETDAPSLHIIAADLVAFPESDGYLPKLLMELNSMMLGKWLANDGGEVMFALEMLPHDTFGKEEFRAYFDRVLVTGSTMKEKLLGVRYGRLTLQRALKGPASDRVDLSKKSVKKLIDQALADG